MFFSACVGTGAQFSVLTPICLILSVIGTFFPGIRFSYTTFILLYALTSLIAGSTSTRLYLQMGGKQWATNAGLTACLFAFPFFCTFSFVNSVAWYYGSTSAFSLEIIFKSVFFWALVIFPLFIIGSRQARKNVGPFSALSRVNRVKRDIPPCPWYRSAAVQIFLAGFLPCSSISLELQYLCDSLLGHRVASLLTIFLIAFVMLVFVTVCTTVALTYFQFAMEDYRWWWRSLLGGASTGLFVSVYAMCYFLYRSETSGDVLQASFFFGSLLMISFACSLMLGTVAYWVAFGFVQKFFVSKTYI